jgi:TP901-1 family phage major tail protein
MATAAIPGFNAKVAVSSDGGSNFFVIGELRDVTLTVEADEIDATSKDSAGWREFIVGLKQWGGSAEHLYLEANTAQDALRNALVNRTLVKLRFRPKGDSVGADQFIGDAIITGWEPALPTDDAVAVSVTFRGTGAIVESTQ